MLSVTFDAPGQPVPYDRVRQGRRGQRWHNPRYRAWYGAVTVAGIDAVNRHRLRRPVWPGGSVALTITFYGARTNADIDNLAKSIMDACEGIMYDNDRQVRRLTATCHPAQQRGPRAVITIGGIDDDDRATDHGAEEDGRTVPRRQRPAAGVGRTARTGVRRGNRRP